MTTYQAPFNNPIRQKIMYFFQGVKVVSFINGHETVNKNNMYIQLSTRSLRDYCKSLDCEVLYEIEYKNKRDLKMQNLVRTSRDFTIHELIIALLMKDE